MIAFDLDGVLVSDIDYNLDISLMRLKLIRPIISPKIPYYIITGRQNDAENTIKMVNKFLSPKKIFCNNDDYKRSAQYKAQVINDNKDITVFIESDKTQVSYLKKHTEITIIHWETVLQKLLENINDRY